MKHQTWKIHFWRARSFSLAKKLCISTIYKRSTAMPIILHSAILRARAVTRIFVSRLSLHASLFLLKYYPSNSRCIAYISLMLCARHRNLLTPVYSVYRMWCISRRKYAYRQAASAWHQESSLRTRKTIMIFLGDCIEILYLMCHHTGRNNIYLILSRESKKWFKAFGVRQYFNTTNTLVVVISTSWKEDNGYHFVI